MEPKYGGLDASAVKRLRELKAENRKLKQMYTDLSLEHQVLKDIVEKTVKPSDTHGLSDHKASQGASRK